MIQTTYAELLRQAGYATAHYGKWHISGGGPGQHGYDEHDGDTGNENAYQFTDPNPVDIFGMADWPRAVAGISPAQAGMRQQIHRTNGFTTTSGLHLLPGGCV